MSYPQNLGYLPDHWPEAPCATPESASLEQKPGTVHQNTQFKIRGKGLLHPHWRCLQQLVKAPLGNSPFFLLRDERKQKHSEKHPACSLCLSRTCLHTFAPWRAGAFWTPSSLFNCCRVTSMLPGGLTPSNLPQLQGDLGAHAPLPRHPHTQRVLLPGTAKVTRLPFLTYSHCSLFSRGAQADAEQSIKTPSVGLAAPTDTLASKMRDKCCKTFYRNWPGLHL